MQIQNIDIETLHYLRHFRALLDTVSIVAEIKCVTVSYFLSPSPVVVNGHLLIF